MKAKEDVVKKRSREVETIPQMDKEYGLRSTDTLVKPTKTAKHQEQSIVDQFESSLAKFAKTLKESASNKSMQTTQQHKQSKAPEDHDTCLALRTEQSAKYEALLKKHEKLHNEHKQLREKYEQLEN